METQAGTLRRRVVGRELKIKEKVGEKSTGRRGKAVKDRFAGCGGHGESKEENECTRSCWKLEVDTKQPQCKKTYQLSMRKKIFIAYKEIKRNCQFFFLSEMI